VPRALRLGLWIGARVGSHRCPVLRPAQLHSNDAVGLDRGDRAKKFAQEPLDTTSSLRDVSVCLLRLPP
jgi:hypothetical protein